MLNSCFVFYYMPVFVALWFHPCTFVFGKCPIRLRNFF